MLLFPLHQTAHLSSKDRLCSVSSPHHLCQPPRNLLPVSLLRLVNVLNAQLWPPLCHKSIFEEGGYELCRIQTLDQLINTIHFHSSLSSASVCSTKHFGIAQRIFFLTATDKYCKFNILQAKLDRSTFVFPQLTDEDEYTKYFECLSTFIMTESFN